MIARKQIVRAWGTVRKNEQVAAATHWLELEAPELAVGAAPGQFLMIGFGASSGAVPFLPRPNSIAALREDGVGLLIRVYGRGSRKLAALRPGDRALLLGPLGTRFELGRASSVLCVAGGVGLAPFLLLPRWLEAQGGDVQVKLLYGERQGDAVFNPEKIFELSGIEAEIWTEDGTRGRLGLVTSGVDLGGVDLVVACGPTAMLKAVRRLSLESGVPCQLAVEAHMACGVGTCIGCAIETVDRETGEEGFALVCMEGPVFPAERLRW